MRINLIAPKYILDQHLLAEFKELHTLPYYYQRYKNRLKGKPIPDNYQIGKGHILFFMDKLKFLENRYNQVLNELKKRKYIVNFKPKLFEKYDKTDFNDYKPAKYELRDNLKTLIISASKKPCYYSYYRKKPVDYKKLWKNLIEKYQLKIKLPECKG